MGCSQGSQVSSAEGSLATRELGKDCPTCPAPERAVGHRDGREETLLLLGEQACDTYAPTPLGVPQEKGVLWRASSPRAPQAWMYGVQGPTRVYRRSVSHRQHRLALHGLRQ